MKEAGGKPSLSAPVEKVTFLEYAWPEFTMGDELIQIRVYDKFLEVEMSSRYFKT